MRGNLLRRLVGANRQREIKGTDEVKVFENTHAEDILVDFPSRSQDDESDPSVGKDGESDASDVDDDGFLGWSERNTDEDEDVLIHKSSEPGLVVVETKTAKSCIVAWGGRGVCFTTVSSFDSIDDYDKNFESDESSEHSTGEDNTSVNHIRDADAFEKPSNWVGGDERSGDSATFEKPSNWVDDETSDSDLEDDDAYRERMIREARRRNSMIETQTEESEPSEKPSNWVDDESSDSDSEDDNAYRERMMLQARKRNSMIEAQTEEQPEPSNYEDVFNDDVDSHIRKQTMRQTRRLSMPAFSSTAIEEENPFVGSFFSPTSEKTPTSEKLSVKLVPVQEKTGKTFDEPEKVSRDTRPRRRASVSHSSYFPSTAPEPAVAAPSPTPRPRMSRRSSCGPGSNTFTNPQNDGSNDPFAGGFDSAKAIHPARQPPRQRAARRPSLMQTTYDFEKVKTSEGTVDRKPMRRRASMSTYQPNKEYEDGLKAFGAKSHQISSIYS